MKVARTCFVIVSTIVLMRAGLEGVQAPECRIFSAEETRTVTGAAGGTITQSCRFDLPTTSRVCTMRTRLGATSFDLAWTDKYNSVEDFIDEVKMVPPIARVQSQSRRYLSGNAPNSVLTYSYDSTRRQTKISANLGTSLQVTTYNTWDPKGRPTSATIGSAAPTITLQYKYDDAARTMTLTGPAGVEIDTYDANGNMIKEETTDATGRTLYTIRIDKTDKVCK